MHIGADASGGQAGGSSDRTGTEEYRGLRQQSDHKAESLDDQRDNGGFVSR